MSKTIALLMLLLLAVPALAQLDPDPDGIGVYFDPAATLIASQAFVGETVPAYLILTRPSQAGGLALWEAYVGPAGFNAMVRGTPVGGGNMLTTPPGNLGVSFAVGMDQPYPALQTVTILAELQISVTGGGPVELWVGGYSYELPFYRLDDFYHGTEGFMTPSSGSTTLPVAVINGDDPVAADVLSWGGVKALYR